MKLATVGVGGAGGRIADRLLEAERRLDRPCCGQNVLVFDTAQPNLDALDVVPSERRILIGDTYPGVDVEATGVDGDAELAVEATREERNEIRRALDDLEVYKADAVLLLAGLGGATGAGAGAVLLEEFRTVYEKPVYAVAALPSNGAPDHRAMTAARGLQSFVRTATNVILFDNETWARNDDGAEASAAADQYREMNDALATRLVSLFGAGELETSAIPESAVDTSDAMRTLATGGVSTIGYATLERPGGGGFLSWLRSLFGGEDDDEVTDAVRIKELVRRALQSPLTVPCDVSSAERAMLILSGAPDALSRRGFENAVYWLESETQVAELLAGDEPRRGNPPLTATILLSNVTDVPRIDSLQQQALECDPLVSVDDTVEASNASD